MFNDYYRGKRVLVTGHHGFKGSWLAFWLKQLGAEVYGLGNTPTSNPNLHEVLGKETYTKEHVADMRVRAAVYEVVRVVEPEVVFHLAAQAIVRRSYIEPISTLESNVIGTAHLLDAIRTTGTKCSTVIVTSDKCYENKGQAYGYREGDEIGGHDVYSASKAAAELVVSAWRRSFFMANVATARGGNVIGGGDYAEDRIVPDCIRALMEGVPIKVRNPESIRPWQHVLDCLSGYLWLGARLKDDPRLCSPFNFGPASTSVRSVKDLVDSICEMWPGTWVDGSEKEVYKHEANTLTLSIEKAALMLQWRPVWSFEESVGRTVAWYYSRHQIESNMVPLTMDQIDDYTQDAKELGLSWAQ